MVEIDLDQIVADNFKKQLQTYTSPVYKTLRTSVLRIVKEELNLKLSKEFNEIDDRIEKIQETHHLNHLKQLRKELKGKK